MVLSLSPIKTNSHQQNQTIADLQNYIASYGYDLMDLPIIQPAELFLTKVGDELINKLFTFERYGQQLALRPEFTASAAYSFAQQKVNQLTRWQFQGPIFIDDPNSFTHDYQRQSLGVELIGWDSPLADAEIIALAANGMNAIGIQDYYLMLGHVGLIRQLLTHFKLDTRTERFLLNHLSAFNDPEQGKAYVLEQLEKSLLRGTAPLMDQNQPDLAENTADQNIDYTTQEALGLLLDATQRGMTMGGRSRHDIARRLLQKHRRIADKEQIVKAIDFLETVSTISEYPLEQVFEMLAGFVAKYSPEAQSELDNWRAIIDLLDAYDIPADRIRIHPELVRGWDYYTGIVFELHNQDSVHLGGGGRYDELIALIGNRESVAAVGFAYYLEDVLQSMPDADDSTAPVYQLVVHPQATVQVSRWAHNLRGYGLQVALVEASDQPEHITIGANGQAIFQNKSYSETQIELLIAHLQQG